MTDSRLLTRCAVPRALTRALCCLLAPAALLAAPSVQAQGAGTPASTRVLSREAVTARYADAESKFIDVDGVRLHYKDQGSGPAVLLVHGTMGDLGDWDGWAAVLSRSHRVLRIDLPGFGLSGPIASGNYSIDRMQTLVDGFMDRVDAPRFAIAGISYGGLLSFRYAATRTDRVTALILANSAGIETGRASSAQATAQASAQASAAAAAVASAPAPAALPPAAAASAVAATNVFFSEVVTAADVDDNLHHMLSDHTRITPQLVQRKLAYINIAGRGDEARLARMQYERGDPQRVLAHVKAPALVLWGGANKALSAQTADAFVGALKNACQVERQLFPEGGHMLIIDRAPQTVAAAQAFLARVGKGLACRRSPA